MIETIRQKTAGKKIKPYSGNGNHAWHAKKQCYVMLGFSEKVCEHQGFKMKLYEAIGGSLTTTGSVGN